MGIRRRAQQMGFTLDEVAELVGSTRLVGAARGPSIGLQERTRAKIAEVDARLAELSAVRDVLCAALKAGCEDLVVCSSTPGCPLPSSSQRPQGGTDGGKEDRVAANEPSTHRRWWTPIGVGAVLCELCPIV